ncbi:hypothetical protein [Sphingosinicella sp. CPCC 101087]|uniref:hypothetical protein n=1 Tax=Sphingosinicella sp. CPCC 101087 TaxID=2497754 RepID=UPI00197F9822|nr:hypothetical protein [Sphingosinicella sp. CPCC 101087]
MKITEGHLDAFREAVGTAIDFVEANGPQLMVRTFVDEQAMRAVNFQLYRNSDDILRHWALSDPYIKDVSAHCTVEAFEVYGDPASGYAPASRNSSATDAVSWSCR